jgi:hypothetical protein
MKINKVEDGTRFALGVAVEGIGVCEEALCSKVRVVCSLSATASPSPDVT